MIEPIFSREAIDRMRPSIQNTVDTLLDDMIKDGCKNPVDVVEKLALPVASYVSSLFAPRRSTSDMFGCFLRPSTESSVYHLKTSSFSHSKPPSAAMGALLQPPHPKQTSRSHVSSHICYFLTNRSPNRDLLEYIGKLVDKRVSEPNGDLISKIVTEQVSKYFNLYAPVNTDKPSLLARAG